MLVRDLRGDLGNRVNPVVSVSVCTKRSHKSPDLCFPAIQMCICFQKGYKTFVIVTRLFEIDLLNTKETTSFIIMLHVNNISGTHSAALGLVFLYHVSAITQPVPSSFSQKKGTIELSQSLHTWV